MTKNICYLTLIVVLQFGCLPAHSFDAFPIRLYVDASRSTTTLTLTNNGTSDVVLQPRVERWQQIFKSTPAQPAGELTDSLTKTDDFTVFPIIVSLKPGAKQTVRLRFNKASDATQELSYRVTAEEILAKPVEGIVNFAHAVSIPLFVRALKDDLPDLKWLVQKADAGSYEIAANNQGGTHIQITKFSARRLTTDGTKTESTIDVPLFAYLLPGSRRTIALPITKLIAGLYEVVLTTDYKPLEATIDLR